VVDEQFAYSNLSTRPRGRFVALAGRVLPGIARVQADVEPFAAQWRTANLAALESTGPLSGEPLWIALGDSLSQGIGASAFDRGWVGQLHTRFAEHGTPMRLVNLSVSGARTADVLDMQIPALSELAERDAWPDLVTLMIGSNDLMGRRYRDRMPERMDRILRQLPSGSLVTTLPNPTATANAVNAVIEHVASERGLVVAELRQPRTASWRGKLAADHFHPNDRGYAALADVVESAINNSGKEFI
jgi:lysophospholipase L1-like esterase